MPQIVEAIAKSRREANKVKREQPITVVIGNPPYKNQGAGDRATGSRRAAAASTPLPMDRWTPPADWGVGRTRTISRISTSISGDGRR